MYLILFLVCLLTFTHAALQPPLFNRIPTGSVKPTGWALGQARVQASGLAGHLRDFDSYVNGSIWVEGGSIEYSEMHESAPYWFNGMVALAFQLQDPRLLSQVEEFMTWTLDHQQEDGWIGPEPPLPANATTPRLNWPRYLILLGLIQYAEADPQNAPRIIDAMHKYVSLVNTIWKAGQQGQSSQGFQFDHQFVRWEELVYSLQWLHDNAPQGQEDMLEETMKLVRDTGYSWKTNWFTPATFPQDSPAHLTMQTHGVNTGEALKSEALAWRFTNDPTDIQSTWDRIDMLYKYHGRASGTFGADEHYAGLNPSRGTELCAVVEQIFSLATVYQIFGNNSVADRVEKLAYNALPAALMPDWKSHQYDQEVNQIWATTMNPAPWGSNGPNSNVFGFEPNYPCCTVNHPQAFPKFWAHNFFTTQDRSGLVHAFLGPASFEGTLGESNQVKVDVNTLYPFGSVLRYTIHTDEPFMFQVRIPDWAQNANSTVSVNNSKASKISVDDKSMQTIKVGKGTTTMEIFLHSSVVLETRFNGAIAVTRGALNYAVNLAFNDTATPGLRSGQALGDVRRLYPNAPAQYLTSTDNHTQDHSLLPTVEWRIAIDPSTLKVIDKSSTATQLPEQIWAPGAPPVSMTAMACQINWPLVNGTAAPPPQSPNACIEGVDKFEVELIPFAAAKLRLGEIPVMV